MAGLLSNACLRRFTELAKLVDPNNEPKTDKLSVLGEAIRYVQQAHVQISQAQTLQKFLEVCASVQCAGW